MVQPKPPQRHTFALLVGLLHALAGPCPAIGGNWPGWRGPGGTGVSPERHLPLYWGTQDHVRWRVPLPGPGDASPVVWGRRIFVAQAADQCATIMCFDRADGKLLWQCGVIDVAPGGWLQDAPACSATPVTDGERVIALFGSQVCCLNFNGEELWRRAVQNPAPGKGIQASPVLYRDLCILSLNPQGHLLALDKHTGRKVWEVGVPAAGIATGRRGSDAALPARSTPLLIEGEGRPQLILVRSERLCAFEPEAGRALWSYDGLGRRVDASPLWDGRTIVAMSSLPDPRIMAVDPGGAAAISLGRRRWSLERARSCTGSGVFCAGSFCLVDDEGIAQCLELERGRTVWERRLSGPDGPGPGWPSLLASGNIVYVPTRQGDVFVLRVAAQVDVLATNCVYEPTGASLAASDGEIFMRTDKSLWCFGEAKTAL